MACRRITGDRTANRPAEMLRIGMLAGQDVDGGEIRPL